MTPNAKPITVKSGSWALGPLHRGPPLEAVHPPLLLETGNGLDWYDRLQGFRVSPSALLRVQESTCVPASLCLAPPGRCGLFFGTQMPLHRAAFSYASSLPLSQDHLPLGYSPFQLDGRKGEGRMGRNSGTAVLGEERVGHRGRGFAHPAPTPPSGDSSSNSLVPPSFLLPRLLSAGVARLEGVQEAA